MKSLSRWLGGISLLVSLSVSGFSQESRSWDLAWRFIHGTPENEIRAVLLGDPSCSPVLWGRSGNGLFRAPLNSKGELRAPVQSIEDPEKKLLLLKSGAQGSWGAESVTFSRGSSSHHLEKRNRNGAVRWNLEFPSSESIRLGPLRDGWGNHWVIFTESGQSGFRVSKVTPFGERAWTRAGSGEVFKRLPNAWARKPGGGFIIASYYPSALSSYDSEMNLEWEIDLKLKEVPRGLAVARDGHVFLTTVSYDRRDWHSKLFSVSPDGQTVRSTRVDRKSFSGWRLAADQRGGIYIAGTLGEPGNILIFEFDRDLQELSRFSLPGRTHAFIGGIHASRNGKFLTLSGAGSPILGKATGGKFDAFAIQLKRPE